jgi:hypothetical protein
MCQVHFKVKVMLIFFWHERGCSLGWCPQKLNINQYYYVEVLKQLGPAICHKMPNKQNSHLSALHHDNAPTHTTHLVHVLFPWFNNHPIPLIRLPVTPGCFPNLKWH